METPIWTWDVDSDWMVVGYDPENIFLDNPKGAIRRTIYYTIAVDIVSGRRFRSWRTYDDVLDAEHGSQTWINGDWEADLIRFEEDAERYGEHELTYVS
jgi:hypothetical protein